jgi:hypothetical protein
MITKMKFSNGMRQSRTVLSQLKTRSSFDVIRRAAVRAGKRRVFVRSSA